MRAAAGLCMLLGCGGGSPQVPADAATGDGSPPADAKVSCPTSPANLTCAAPPPIAPLLACANPSWGTPISLGTGRRVEAMHDLDNDGDPDLLFIGPRLSIARNQGGTFGALEELSITTDGGYLTAAAMNDLDRDGHVDIAVAAGRSRSVGSAYVFLGTTAQSTFVYQPIAMYGAQPAEVLVGDLGCDCRNEVVVVNAGYIDTFHNVTYPGSIDILSANADGTYVNVSSLAIANRTAVLADLDNDGQLDLVASDTNGGTSWLRRNGDLIFAPAIKIAPATATLAVGDLDHDSKLDLAGDFGVSLATGNGTFATPVPTEARPPLGDVNGDGHLDLLSKVALGNGDGTFGTATNNIGLYARRVFLGDVDGDQRADLVIYNHPANSHMYLQSCP